MAGPWPILLQYSSRELGLIKNWSIDSGDVSLIMKFTINSFSILLMIICLDQGSRLEILALPGNLLKSPVLEPHPRSNKSENLGREQQFVLTSSSDDSDAC